MSRQVPARRGKTQSLTSHMTPWLLQEGKCKVFHGRQMGVDSTPGGVNIRATMRAPVFPTVTSTRTMRRWTQVPGGTAAGQGQLHYSFM